MLSCVDALVRKKRYSRKKSANANHRPTYSLSALSALDALYLCPLSECRLDDRLVDLNSACAIFPALVLVLASGSHRPTLMMLVALPLCACTSHTFPSHRLRSCPASPTTHPPNRALPHSPLNGSTSSSHQAFSSKASCVHLSISTVPRIRVDACVPVDWVGTRSRRCGIGHRPMRTGLVSMVHRGLTNSQRRRGGSHRENDPKARTLLSCAGRDGLHCHC